MNLHLFALLLLRSGASVYYKNKSDNGHSTIAISLNSKSFLKYVYNVKLKIENILL